MLSMSTNSKTDDEITFDGMTRPVISASEKAEVKKIACLNCFCSIKFLSGFFSAQAAALTRRGVKKVKAKRTANAERFEISPLWRNKT